VSYPAESDTSKDNYELNIPLTQPAALHPWLRSTRPAGGPAWDGGQRNNIREEGLIYG